MAKKQLGDMNHDAKVLGKPRNAILAEVKTDDIDEFVDALVYIEEPIVLEVERVEVVKLGMLVPALADLIRQLGERELREIERPGLL